MINRGSEWEKWDLHIHTPYSILNNQFGDPKTKFDLYVRKMLKKALEKNIKVIGLTDYYLITGYKNIKKEYLENIKRLKYIENPDISEELKKELEFSEGEIEQIKKILFLPNIEFREKTVINGSKVNFHVIFSDKIACSDIESYFLKKIEYKHKEKAYHLTIESLTELGKIMKEDNSEFKKSDLETGMEQVRICLDDVKKVLQNDERFSGKYFIFIDPDEDLSDIDWDGQDSSTRKDFIYKSDAFFTSSEGTIKFGLGEKGVEKKKFIETFGTLKPTFHGSDAHETIKLFEPDGQRYTWVKSRLTFEGLREAIIEPEKRVKIQSIKPGQKIAREIIKSIKFINKEGKNFISEKEIYFNKDLNSIIGGKGSGKSFLLYSLIKVIGEDKLLEISGEQEEHKLIFDSYNTLIKENIENIIVTFEDGEVYDFNKKGKVAFTYLPQNYLFKLSQDINKDKNFLKMLKDVLDNESDLDIYNLENDLNDKLEIIKSKLQTDVMNLVNNKKEKENLNLQLKEYGEIEQLKNSISLYKRELSTIEIDTVTLDRYSKLQKDINICKNNKETLILKISEIEKIFNSIVTLDLKNLILNKLDFSDNNKDILDDYIIDYIDDLNVSGANDKLRNKKENIILTLNNEMEELKDNILKNENEIKTLNSSVSDKEKFDELQKIIKNEEEKLTNYSKLKKEITDLEEKIERLKVEIIDGICEYRLEYANFIKKISSHSNSEILLEVYLEVKVENFIENVGGKILKKRKEIKNFFDEENLINIDKFEDNLKNLVNKLEELEYTGKNNITTFLDSVIEDFYFIKYNLKYNGNDISELSHGKRGIALLKLYLEKDNSTSPLLIDQPEDNLDNRTVFDHLVEFLREKKDKRQIIMVSHNANLVVSTDSENVIVSNEHGTSSENEGECRLAYLNGALEESHVKKEEVYTLKKIGIREHVCQILEGGKEAFKKRNEKYRIIS